MVMRGRPMRMSDLPATLSECRQPDASARKVGCPAQIISCRESPKQLDENHGSGSVSLRVWPGANTYRWRPQNQGVATMNFSASAGEANGPTNLPECLFLKVVPSTHSCSSRYVSPLRNSSTSAARFPSSLYSVNALRYSCPCIGDLLIRHLIIGARLSRSFPSFDHLHNVVHRRQFASTRLASPEAPGLHSVAASICFLRHRLQHFLKRALKLLHRCQELVALADAYRRRRQLQGGRQ